MTILTHTDLSRLCPRPKAKPSGAQWDAYVDGILANQDLFREYGIDTALEWQHVIAQWAHETGGFTVLWESGAYSASRIMTIFGVGKHSAKVTRTEAVRLAAMTGEAKARALFERVYGLGNPGKARELGNAEPGDGYAYRGCGIVQITGRAAHEKYFAGDYSMRSMIRAALREWTDKACSVPALKDDCRRVTKLINGGYNGLPDRERYLAKAKEIWPSCPKFETVKPSPLHSPGPSGSDRVDPVAKSPGKQRFEAAVALGSKSRKWVLMRWQKFIGAGTAGLGLMGASPDDPVGLVRHVRGLLDEFSIIWLVGIGVIAIYIASRAQSHMTDDVVEGRYEPSGGANA